MNQRRAVLRRGDGIEHRRQFFIFNFDQVERVFCLFKRIRRQRRHPLADEAHFVLSQDGNIAIAPAIENAAHVISRKYGPHPRRLRRPRRIDT